MLWTGGNVGMLRSVVDGWECRSVEECCGRMEMLELWTDVEVGVL